MKILNKFSCWYWKDIFYNVKWGVKNLTSHFKIVWSSRPWDFNYSPLEMLKLKLEELYDSIINGHEIEETRDVKLKNIARCIELIENRLKDNYIERCGELSKHPFEFEPVNDSPDSPAKLYKLKEYRSAAEIEADHNIFEKGNELDNKEWVELWTIIKDTDARSWWD